MLLWAAVGVFIGFAIDNIPVGVCIGMMFGIVVTLAFQLAPF